MKKLVKVIISSLLLVTTSQVYAALGQGKTKAEFEKIAIMVFTQNKEAKRFGKTARSRFESILMDNGITVLDQEKAEELKNTWNKLEDPGHFVTAEEFVENAGKYAIDGVLRIYLTADSSATVGNYHSATAQVDIRFMDNEANILTFTTSPMGAPGNPPSDGLTKIAAMVNAVQRAVDKASEAAGLEVIDVANPRLLKYSLEGPFTISKPSQSLLKRKDKPNPEAETYASLHKTDWVKEKVTCNATSPGGTYSAIGGYVFKRTYGRFKYWSNLHLVNNQAQKEILKFGPLKKKTRKKGTSKIVDCMFVYNWRFLAALTEHNLYLWDTERNMLLTSSKLNQHIPEAKLNYFKQGKDDYVVIMTGEQQNLAFKVTRAK